MFLFDSQLFWYKLVFLGELVISEALFTYKFKKRSNFAVRLVCGLLTCAVFTFLFPIWSYDAFNISVMFVSIFAVTVAVMYFCFNVPFTNIVFAGIAAYTVQHLAYEINTLIFTATGLNGDNFAGAYGPMGHEPQFYDAFGFIIYFDCYAVVYWLMYLMFGRRIKKNEDIRISNIFLLVISGIIILVAIILNSIIIYRVTVKSDELLVFIVIVYNILCCLLAISIQFALLWGRGIKKELDTIHRLRYQEHQQYLISKENIDLINLKCHDLRHQIRAIGESGRIDAGIISEIENAIKIYDSAVKTGNETLDIILTEKSLLCKKNSITLTCIVDGEKLGFMNVNDLYSLLGNAIDNAIEAVMRLAGEQRAISITVRPSRAFLSVSISNSILPGSRIEFVDGLPETTKDDKRYHGYGMKSIKAVVDKYGGDLSVSVRENIFNLNMLFPRQDGDEY